MRLGHLTIKDSEVFGTYWIEAGHRIREQVGDDDLLVQFLRLALPRYTGDGAVLYRGENLTRWQTGTVGLAWSLQIDVARMFAGGLNAVGSGGVLLAARFSTSAIISGPNSHSQYLGEDQFTVDPRYAEDVLVLEHFSPA